MSASETERKFNLWGALHGDHRPHRVVLHGIAYLLGFKIVYASLVLSGALSGLMQGLLSLGLMRAIVLSIPFLLLLVYVLFWIWFIVSLYKSARNAETEQGARRARRASVLLGIFLAAVAGLLIALSLVR